MKICRELNNKYVVEYTKTQEQRQLIHSKGYHVKIVFNEKQDLILENRRFSIFPDCIAIIPPGNSFESIIESDFPVHCLSILLNINSVNRFLNEHCPSLLKLLGNELPPDLNEVSLIPMSNNMRLNFQHLLEKIVNCSVEDALLNEYINRFILDYVHSYRNRFLLERRRLPFVKSKTREDISKRLLLTKEYISNNYNQRFRLKDLASASFLSENHLLRTFKEMFGLTPYQYLALVRLSRAKSYLEQDQYLVNEIVILVGLDSVSSFIKLFKSTFKLTPLQYRKRFQSIRNA